jgi:predicted outer membrane repeat protein
MRAPVTLAIPVLLGATAEAATIHVPSEVPTISGALAAAVRGDTVLVASGTYRESIRMADGVVLRGESLFDRPVLDAERSGVALTAVSCQSPTTVEAFVLREGAGEGFGGGASLVESSMIFRHCLFENNAAAHGGGVGAERSSFTIVGCEFRHNTATGSGGAIAATGHGLPRIVNCSFESNDAVAGGAIAVRNGSGPRILANLFDGNGAHLGAAVWFDLLTGGEVEQNTIVFSADREAGGAIYVNALSSPRILSNIIAFGNGKAIVSTPGAGHLYGCNDVFGNADGDGVAGGTDLGTNFSRDPLFCDAEGGDYALHASSPCLPSAQCNLIGAFGPGGCVAVSAGEGLENVSWGAVKARYRGFE